MMKLKKLSVIKTLKAICFYIKFYDYFKLYYLLRRCEIEKPMLLSLEIIYEYGYMMFCNRQ